MFYNDQDDDNNLISQSFLLITIINDLLSIYFIYI